MAIKASDHFKTYHNPNGPDITTLARPVLEQDGLYFKDIDGTGTVSAVNDHTTRFVVSLIQPVSQPSVTACR